MIERIFVFTCDFCESKYSISRYGLPPSWRAVAPTIKTGVLHACVECSKKFQEKELLDKEGNAQFKLKS